MYRSLEAFRQMAVESVSRAQPAYRLSARHCFPHQDEALVCRWTELIDEQVGELTEERTPASKHSSRCWTLSCPTTPNCPARRRFDQPNKKASGSFRRLQYPGFNPGSAKLLEKFNLIGVEPADPTASRQLLRSASQPEAPSCPALLVLEEADKHLQMCATLIKAQDQEDSRICTRTGRHLHQPLQRQPPNLQNISRGSRCAALRKAGRWWIWITAVWNYGRPAMSALLMSLPCGRCSTPAVMSTGPRRQDV